MKVRKPTPLESLASSTEKAFTHVHSATLHSQLRIQRCLLNEGDALIEALASKLVKAKAARAKRIATIDGLDRVLAKRTA